MESSRPLVVEERQFYVHAHHVVDVFLDRRDHHEQVRHQAVEREDGGGVARGGSEPDGALVDEAVRLLSDHRTAQHEVGDVGCRGDAERGHMREPQSGCGRMEHPMEGEERRDNVVQAEIGAVTQVDLRDDSGPPSTGRPTLRHNRCRRQRVSVSAALTEPAHMALHAPLGELQLRPAIRASPNERIPTGYSIKLHLRAALSNDRHRQLRR